MAMNTVSYLMRWKTLNSMEHLEDRISALEEDFLRMYQTYLEPDVKIYLKSENDVSVYFEVHKLILAQRSPVFADMFWNTSNCYPEEVFVDGTTASGLELLLEYIYKDNLETKTVDELIEVAKSARRFEVTSVVRNCKRELSKYPLSVENVFSVLEACKYFKMDLKHEECLSFIKSAPQKNLFKTPGFLQLSGLSIYNVLRQRDVFSGCEAVVLEEVIRWMVHNKIKARKLLSEINVLSLTYQEFIKVNKKFPDFFTHREIASILSNLHIPGCMELPVWCRSHYNSALESETYDSLASKLLKFKTECNRPFGKSYFFGSDGFQESITFEIKLSNQFPEGLYLTMLELAFGSSFVPKDHLKLEILRFKECLNMGNVEYGLQATNDHYYIVLNNRLRIKRNYPFVLKMTIEARRLRKWGVKTPVSNQKYRVAQLPGSIFDNIILNASGYDYFCLTPLSDWLLFIDPVLGEKNFVFTSFYFGH